MNALDLLRGLAANNAWSNLRLHRACARLAKADYEARRTSFFPSIPQTLNHILIVDWYYLDALERGGKGRSLFENEMPFPELDALAAAQREADMRLVAFTNHLQDEASLDAEVQLERPDHVQVERVGDVLLHLDVHQVHHRGQVHAMLAGTPVPPPQLDEFFLREELPLREQELRDLGLPIR
ncbi:MAG TPA: DinB family protein [Candidatus Nanopelagicales bacterium]|nr:DinB family protein [Candidatus Nanopelagicales bacterium]